MADLSDSDDHAGPGAEGVRFEDLDQEDWALLLGATRQPERYPLRRAVVTTVVLLALTTGSAVAILTSAGPVFGGLLTAAAVGVHLAVRTLVLRSRYGRILEWELTSELTVVTHGDVSGLPRRAAGLDRSPLRRFVLSLVVFGAIVAALVCPVLLAVAIGRLVILLGFALVVVLGITEYRLRSIARGRRLAGRTLLRDALADAFALEYVRAGGHPDRLRSGLPLSQFVPRNPAQLHRAVVRAELIRALGGAGVASG